MPVIAVIEDDNGTRTLVASVLRKDGYEVIEAADGAAGLELIREHGPDLVVSDVQMPHLDGFQMLAAMREDPALASIPVILLTSLAERAHMRIGMTTGADDYLTKPFRPGELQEAVAAQFGKRIRVLALQSVAVEQQVRETVRKVVDSALSEQAEKINSLYNARLPRTLEVATDHARAQPTDRYPMASLLFVDILDYPVWSQKLSALELSQLVQQFYRNAGDTVHLFGARNLQFMGEGLLAIFVSETDTRSVTHALRAARAAQGLVEARKRVQQYLTAQFPDRGLPVFDVGIGLHLGAVALTELAPTLVGGPVQVLAVGEGVTQVVALQRAATAHLWRVAATVQMLRSLTGAVKIGRRALLPTPGRDVPIDAAELLGLQTP